jgi:hypothetical protein
MYALLKIHKNALWRHCVYLPILIPEITQQIWRHFLLVFTMKVVSLYSVRITVVQYYYCFTWNSNKTLLNFSESDILQNVGLIKAHKHNLKRF